MSDVLHIDGKKYLPVAAAAELYGFTEAELAGIASGGSIRATRMGKKLYIEFDSLQTYLNPPPVPELIEADMGEEVAPTQAPEVPVQEEVASRPHVTRVSAMPRPRAILPYFVYAAVVLFFVIVFGGSGYVALSQYGPGAVDESYVAAVGVTEQMSFPDRFRSFIRNLFGFENEPVLDWPEITEKSRPAPRPTAAAPPPAPAPVAASTPPAPAPKVVERVIERVVVERPTPKLSSGITEEYLNARLQEIDARLSSQILSVRAQAPVTATTIVQQATAGATRIDGLDDITLSNSTITGSSVSATSLTVTGGATSTFGGGISVSSGCVSVNGTCLGTGGTIGSGTAGQFPYYAAAGTTLSATSTVFLSTAGFLGLGTTTPFRKLSVAHEVASAQFALAYDTTRVTQFQTDASGDLVIDPSGNEVLLSDDNLMVCTSGCGTSPSGTGNILAENKLGVGTTTPNAKLTVETQDSTSDFLRIASSTNQSILYVGSNGRIGVGSSTPFAQLSLGANMAITTSEKSLGDGTTITVDWRQGNQQYVTLGGNRTINFTSYVGGQILRLFVCQDSTGSRTVTWDSNVSWQGGSAPTLTTTASQCDLVTFAASTVEGTLKIYGAAALNF